MNGQIVVSGTGKFKISGLGSISSKKILQYQRLWEDMQVFRSNSETANLMFGGIASGESSISGDKLVIGSWTEYFGPTSNNVRSGIAYTFTWNGTSWVKGLDLQPQGLRNSDYFGRSVSMSGDKLAIGAPGDDHGGTLYNNVGKGAVYTYTWDGTKWNQGSVLRPTLDVSDAFGSGVSMSDNILVVGASGDGGSNNNISNSGAVYTFTWNGSSWILLNNVLRPTGLDVNDYFGFSLSLSDNKLAIGAYGDAGSSNLEYYSGAVYTYTWNGTSWLAGSVLRPELPSANDSFGYKNISISGDKLAIGAPGDDDLGTNEGAVYTYTWDGTSWVPGSVLRSTYHLLGNRFGTCVSISGDKLVIGDVGYNNKGGVHLYIWNGSSWSFDKILSPSVLENGDYFGERVLLSDNKLVVGAPRDDGVSNLNQTTGAVYTFKLVTQII